MEKMEVESIFEDGSQYAKQLGTNEGSECECYDCDYNCEECDGQDGG